MQAGATLGRRFTVVRTVAHDLPGVERWVAQDARRAVEVNLDVLTSLAPSAVRRAAVRAAQVRDARFARVIASGREVVDGERVTYVVTERPRGVDVGALAGERIVPPGVTASIVGEAARALQVASAQGIHHGYLRPACLTVTDAGRVVVAGLDADGELATQASLGRGSTEQADAAALGRILLALITGMDPAQVTIGDLPAGLPLAMADLARAAVAGTGPSTLGQVADALGPADVAGLRRLRGTVGALTEVEHEEPPRSSAVAIGSGTLAAAEREAAAAVSAGIADAVVAYEIAEDHIDTTAMTVAPSEPSAGGHRRDPRAQYATPEEAAQFSKRTRKAVERTRDQPLGLDTFEDINDEQNAGDDRSLWQAMLEFTQRHVPENAPLDAAVERARERAGRSGPINSGPLLVGLVLTGLVIIGFVAYENLIAPFDPGDQVREDPVPDYPSFTYSPEPLPSPSAE
ncbi:hypothetical protein [Demequina sp. NBRC 110056]|uniref:hypothetical protein n=1 Tax=Demequina sp. NBRC 110056 TaxID=1570345 RepID=UPI000A059D21|nr:hypothetical protein [Demequina sp. NBRC 110056]